MKQLAFLCAMACLVLLHRCMRSGDSSEASPRPQPPTPEQIPLLPDVQDISEVKLGASQFKEAGELSEAQFKRLIARGRLLREEAAERTSKAWSYSPWYLSSFQTKDGTYRVSLFLGGLGIVSSPDGSRGYFLYAPPQNRNDNLNR